MPTPKSARPTESDQRAADHMIQQELACGAFPDERLGRRLGLMLQQFVDGTAESVPLACQDWANTKAAYRFFDNERVTRRGHSGRSFPQHP